MFGSPLQAWCEVSTYTTWQSSCRHVSAYRYRSWRLVRRIARRSATRSRYTDNEVRNRCRTRKVSSLAIGDVTEEIYATTSTDVSLVEVNGQIEGQ